jgi:retinol dehydrogenase-12
MAPTQLKKMSALNAFFPPAPTFTDANLPSQKGRVVIVTGAASGVGFELVKILYLAGGTVYIAARSTSRCEVAIQKLLEETRYLGTGKDGMVKGKLESMVVDLADLRTVKPAVESFLQKEERLDVLVHNAAVMTPPAGSKDKLVSFMNSFRDFVFASDNDWCERVTISNSERIASHRTS